MATTPILLATFATTKPVAVGIGIAALVLLYLGFRAAKFVMKMLLVLAALVVIGLAVWWYYAAHHGGPPSTKPRNGMAAEFLTAIHQRDG